MGLSWLSSCAAVLLAFCCVLTCLGQTNFRKLRLISTAAVAVHPAIIILYDACCAYFSMMWIIIAFISYSSISNHNDHNGKVQPIISFSFYLRNETYTYAACRHVVRFPSAKYDNILECLLCVCWFHSSSCC
jgi:hypothetical protein